MKRVLFSFIIIFVFTISINSATINVPADQPTIQAGIDASVNGDTVLVAAGTYTENIGINSKNIKILSSDGAIVTFISASNIDLISFNGVDSTAELSGFSLFTTGNFETIAIISGSPTIHNNILYGNTNGYTIRLWSNTDAPSIHHNLFRDNSNITATVYFQGPAIFYNNTIVNSSRGLFPAHRDCVAINNIIYNIQNDAIVIGSSGLIDYNNSYNCNSNYTGNNNISVDPLFVDTLNNDYNLQLGSPCIDAGNPDSQYNDPDGTRNDMGAFPYQAPFSIQNTFVEDDTLNLHVINHTPELSWSFTDSTIQTEFEIAIGTDNDWAFAEMWNPAPITSADTFITYNGSSLIDGETYYGRLKVSNGTAWSDWFEFSFRMNSKPSTPVALSPIDNALTNSTPTLWIENSFDAENDSLFYDFSGNEVFENGIVYEPLLATNKLPEGTDSTGLTVPSALEENSQYVWEVRAYDRYEYSGWTTLLASSFYVNEFNEAPSAPVAMEPFAAMSPLYNLLPTFEWIIGFDPDPLDSVYYRLHLTPDSTFNFTHVIDSIPIETRFIPYKSYYTLSMPLEYNSHYWWKVEAVDMQGLVSSIANTQHFWTTCCIGIRGNVSGDIFNNLDIADLVFLVAYMFQGGAEPLCIDEANIDGTGGETPIDIADLVALVGYMFQSGDAPADCP